MLLVLKHNTHDLLYLIRLGLTTADLDSLYLLDFIIIFLTLDALADKPFPIYPVWGRHYNAL